MVRRSVPASRTAAHATARGGAQVDVLDAQGQAFRQAQTAAVEELADVPKGRGEFVDYREDLPAREDCGEVLRAPRALQAVQLRHGKVEDAAIREDERAEGLVVRGRRGAALDREVIEESGDVGRGQLARVA